MLKDLKGRSYMQMGFYKKVSLPSEKMRIIDLVVHKKKNKKKVN